MRTYEVTLHVHYKYTHPVYGNTYEAWLSGTNAASIFPTLTSRSAQTQAQAQDYAAQIKARAIEYNASAKIDAATMQPIEARVVMHMEYKRNG